MIDYIDIPGEKIDAAFDQTIDDGDDLKGWPFGPLDAYDAYRDLSEDAKLAAGEAMRGREFKSTDPWSCSLTPVRTDAQFEALTLGSEVEYLVDLGDIDGKAEMGRDGGFVIALPPNCPDGHVVIEDCGGEWKLIDRHAESLSVVTR